MSPSEQANRRASGSFSPMIFRKQKTPSGMDPDVSRLGIVIPETQRRTQIIDLISGLAVYQFGPKKDMFAPFGSYRLYSCERHSWPYMAWAVEFGFLPFLSTLWHDEGIIHPRFIGCHIFFASFLSHRQCVRGIVCIILPGKLATLAKATAHSHWAMEVCVTPGAPLR